MWLAELIILSILYQLDRGSKPCFWAKFMKLISECDHYTQKNLARDHLVPRTPLPANLDHPFRFENDVEAFAKQIQPISELFAASITQKNFHKDLILKMTRRIRKTFRPMRHLEDYFSSADYYKFILQKYEDNVYRPIETMLSEIDLLVSTNYTDADINLYSQHCFDQHMRLLIDIDFWNVRKCKTTQFSPRTASTIFDILETFSFVDYTITAKEEMKFNERYAALYFFLSSPRFTINHQHTLNKFINDKKGLTYQNKFRLLEDLMNSLGQERENSSIRYNGDPNQALSHVSFVNTKLAPVVSYFAEWFDNVLQSTWPTTETELVRLFLKEAADGHTVPENSEEFQRIANVVHEKMRSIGHSSYIRQYLVTTDSAVKHDNPNFYFNCSKNSCSRGASMGVQCITIRIPKNRLGNMTALHNFDNFTTKLSPIFLDAMAKKFHSFWFIPNVVHKISIDNAIRLDEFNHHSSFIGLHIRQYWKNCKVLFGMRAEATMGSMAIRTIHYHRDGGVFSMCNDWWFLFGL